MAAIPVYIVSPLNYARSRPLADYDSLIWTERYSDLGDFQLTASAKDYFINFFNEGDIISIDVSDRLMIVEKKLLEKKNNSYICVVSGRSIEKIFMDRYVSSNNQFVDYQSTTRASDLLKMFVTLSVYKSTDSSDNVPGLLEPFNEGLYSAYTGEDAIQSISFERGATVYSELKKYCDTFGYGFSLTRYYDSSNDNKNLIFSIFGGPSSVPKSKILGSQYGNLINESFVSDSSEYKNVAQCFTEDWKYSSYYRRPDGNSAKGFARKRLVFASDLKSADYTTKMTELYKALAERARVALTEYTKKFVIDGELPKTENLNEYKIGDLYNLVTKFGAKGQARITEKVITCDQEGILMYPSFSATLL